jgi:RNA polymerase sigma factor (sigma-70 family)
MSQLATEYQIREQMYVMLYEEYQEPIKRHLFVRWVHNLDIADDLCQETFKQLWESLRKETVVKQYAYYENWLYKTATYRAIDYLRQNKPIVYLSQSESEANSWFDELRTEGLEDRIDFTCTQDDLLQLPPKQRYSVVKHAEGYNLSEIAEDLGVGKSTVSGYISQGRTNLRNRKSFAVTADLEERRRVSGEIDRIINMIEISQLELLSKIASNMQHGGYFTKEASLDPFSMAYEVAYELQNNEELRSEVVPELKSVDNVNNVLDDYMEEDALVKLVPGTGTIRELLRFGVQETLTLTESDQLSIDVERYLDRTIRKPWRRVLIDAENKRRGLLSDTAVLGAYGQYLF